MVKYNAYLILTLFNAATIYWRILGINFPYPKRAHCGIKKNALGAVSLPHHDGQFFSNYRKANLNYWHGTTVEFFVNYRRKYREICDCIV